MAIILISIIRIRNLLILIIIIFSVCLAFYRSEVVDNQKVSKVSMINEGEVEEISVIVKQQPEQKAGKNLVVANILDNQGIKIQLYTSLFPRYQYGDLLEISGNLVVAGKNNQNYKRYLQTDNIFYEMYYPQINKIGNQKNWLTPFYIAKQKGVDKLNQLFPEPQAAFLAGLLLGEKSGFSENLLKQFKITGISHIIVLSGYNIAIIAKFLIRILKKRINRKLLWLVVTSAIIIFVLVTGAESSSVRAAIMGGVALLAITIGRKSAVKNTLLLSAATMVFIEPGLLLNDVGFQLSFLATAGIVLSANKINEKLWWLPETFAVRESASTTLAAQTLVVPLLLWHFKTISVISPLANVLLLAILPVVMFFGVVAVLISFIYFPLATMIAFIPWALLEYALQLVKLLAAIPFASLNLTP
ncbi:MAG: hypothetical protein ACD_68C00042G0003 [uncultured bacterium]|nr:MAG: hypothetical protein ACD_68C00042G0003 [uncultured bacterium]